jgi:hypothetical protein
MTHGCPPTDAAFEQWLERRFPSPLPLEDRVAAGRTRAWRQVWAWMIAGSAVLAGTVWAAFTIDAAFPMDDRPREPPVWADDLGGVLLLLGTVSAVMALIGCSRQLQAPWQWLPRAASALTSPQWSELSREMTGRRPVVPGDETLLDLWAQRIAMSTSGAWLAATVCVLLSSDSVSEWRPTPMEWVLLVVPAGLAVALARRQWIARGYLRRRRVTAVPYTG